MNQKYLHIRMPEDLKNQLKIAAEKKGLNLSAYIKMILKESLK